MLITVMLIASALVSYVLGGINGAIIASKLVYRSDVREKGSGNAGLTNFLRNYGFKGSPIVFVIDVLKGLIAVFIGGWLVSLAAPEGMEEYFLTVGRAFSVFFVVLGHCYPAYYGFKGGKGILCGAAAVFVLDYHAGITLVVIFAIVFGLSKYVSLASVVAALSLPIAMLVFGHKGLPVWLCAFAVALVVLRHRTNLSRLIRGTEPKHRLRRNVSDRLDEDAF